MAGVRFLYKPCEDFDNGTGDNFHAPFIRDLLMEVFRASGIALDMPEAHRYMRDSNVSTGHQEKGRLLAFLAGPDGERLTL